MQKELKNLLISKTIISAVSGFLIVGLPLYLASLNLDLSKIGNLFGIAMIIYSLLVFLIGSLSDFKGRLKFGVLAIIGMVVGLLLIGVAPLVSVALTMIFFITGKILFNFSESVSGNLVKLRILDLSKGKKLGKNYGLLITAISIGNGLSLIIGGLLLYKINFSMLFLILAVLMVLSLLFYKRTGEIKVSIKREKISLRKELQDSSKTFRLVLLLTTLLIIGSFLTDFFGLPLFQKEILLMSDSQILIILGVAWTFYGIFSIWGGRLYDRYGFKLFIASLILIGLTSIAMAFAKNVYLFSLILILDYILFAFADPARFALVGKVSYHKKGRLLSIFDMVGIFCSAIIIMFFGKIVGYLGFEFIFIFRAIMQFIGVVLLVLIYYSMKKSKSA